MSDDRRAELEQELYLPARPPALDYLWSIYWRLRRRNGGNGFGVTPISWQEIDAYLRHARIVLAPWEVSIIEDLDDAYLASKAKRKPADDQD